MKFKIKDSGARQQFDSGMVRDIQEGKTDYWRALDGPMLDRWAEHLTKGAIKYPDVAPLVPNWTLAAGEQEIARFKASALRHFLQWFRGETDEDHAAAVFFNVNGAEYVKARPAPEKDPAAPTLADCRVCGKFYAHGHVCEPMPIVDEVPHSEGFGVMRRDEHKMSRTPGAPSVDWSAR